MLNRRGFLKLLGAATALSAGGIALIDTQRTFFLPPQGGWHQALRVRKIQQDNYRIRYDATWDKPNGESCQYHVNVVGDYFDTDQRHYDEPAIALLKNRMAFDVGIPNSAKFKLELPRHLVPAEYIYV